MIGAKNQPEEVTRAMVDIAAIPEAETVFHATRRLSDGLQSAKSSLATADPRGILRPVYTLSGRFAMDLNAAESARAQAMRLLDVSGTWDGQMSIILIQQWPSLTPRLRSELVTALCSRLGRCLTLISGVETLNVPRGDLSSFQIKFLLASPDEGLHRRVANIYGNGAMPSRQNIVDQYAGAARMAGTRERGRALFLAQCGDCHQSGNDGNLSGPVLKGLSAMGREKVLAKILDPNGNLPTNNAAILVVTGDGDALAGNITAQNARGITLCQPNGALRVIGRQNVQSQISLGISVMPEGLEARLNQQDMADLLEYLCSGSTPSQ